MFSIKSTCSQEGVYNEIQTCSTVVWHSKCNHIVLLFCWHQIPRSVSPTPRVLITVVLSPPPPRAKPAKSGPPRSPTSIGTPRSASRTTDLGITTTAGRCRRSTPRGRGATRSPHPPGGSTATWDCRRLAATGHKVQKHTWGNT